MSPTMEMDRRTRETLREIERNESLQDRMNLTPEQARWEDAFQHVKKGLSPQTHADLPYTCLGFVQMDNPDRGRFDMISPDRLIHRCERIFVVFLTRIDARHWRGHNQRKQWRLHLQTARFRLDGDGELWADTLNDDKAWQDRMITKDVAKPPMQDHPRYNLVAFNPDAMLGQLQDPVLKAPISGKFSMTVNDRHMELNIGDIPVFRLLASQAGTVMTHADDDDLAQDGQHVKRGAKLVKLTTKTDYGEIRWEKRHDRIPDIDRINGDVLAATRQPRLVAMASEMMRRIGLASSEDALDEAIAVQPLERWAPRHLIEFQANTLDSLPMVEQWTATPALRLALMEGLQPNGGFYARADVPETTTFVGSQEHEHYIELLYDNGHTQVLPRTAKLLGHVTEGATVEPEAPIADWVERRFYDDWDDVRTSFKQVAHATREFLRQIAVRPGTSGFDGEGLLVDQQFLPNEAAVRSGAIGHYVDLRPAAQYLDPGLGVLIGCPLRHEDWTDWYRTACGIGYNAEPSGDRLSGNPVIGSNNGRPPRRR